MFKNKEQQLISEEEYQQALQKLKSIEEEQICSEELQITNKFQSYKSLPQSFEELLIYLKHENNSIKSQIAHLKKEFLESTNLPKNARTEIENKINLFIISISGSTPPSNLTDIDPELLALQNNYPTFEPFITTIKELISQYEINTYLSSYIEELQAEQEQALTIKLKYEKQQKKIKTKKSLFAQWT